MITIQRYFEELNARGKPVSHGFDFTYTDEKQNARNGVITFTQRKFEEERKSDTTTLLQYFESLAKQTYAIPSDKPNTVSEYKTADEIKTKLGDNTLNT